MATIHYICAALSEIDNKLQKEINIYLVEDKRGIKWQYVFSIIIEPILKLKNIGFNNKLIAQVTTQALCDYYNLKNTSTRSCVEALIKILKSVDNES